MAGYAFGYNPPYVLGMNLTDRRPRHGTVGGPCRTPRVESERISSDEVDQ